METITLFPSQGFFNLKMFSFQKKYCQTKLLILVLIGILLSSNSIKADILNGSFTNAGTNWITQPNFYCTNSIYTAYKTSPGYAWFGSSSGQPTNSIWGTLTQSFVMASSYNSASIDFYTRISTDEVSTTTGFDYMNCTLTDGTTNEASKIVLTNLDATTGYVKRTIPIPTSMASHTLTLTFYAQNDAAKPTVFRIDDVSLTVNSTPTPTIGSVLLVAPNGGETIIGGTTTTISWTTTGNISSLELQYTTDNGVNWTSFATPSVSNTSYSWTVPSSINSNQCKVKVLGYYNGAYVYDISNNVFTISQPTIGTVQIVAPNGGESIISGTTTSISWTTTGNISTLELQYTTDNGVNWTSFATPSINNTSYLWSVPSTINSTQCKVKILGYFNGSNVYDISNNLFKIISYPLGSYIDFQQTTLSRYVVVNDAVTFQGTLKDVNGNTIPNFQITMEDGLQQMSRPGPTTDNNGNFSCSSTAKYSGMSEIIFILPNGEKQAVYINVFGSTNDFISSLAGFLNLSIFNDTENYWNSIVTVDAIEKNVILKPGEKIRALTSDSKRNHFPLKITTSAGMKLNMDGGIVKVSVSENNEGIIKTSASVGEALYRGKIYYTSTGDFGGCWAPGIALPIIVTGEVSLCVGTDGVSVGGSLNGSFFNFANIGANLTIKLYEFNSGINDLNFNNKFKLYPNPVKEYLTVEYEDNFNGMKFEIISSTGQIVYNGELSNKITINTSHLNSGIYLLKIQDGTICEYRKIIKE